jgi:hypothetical protein
VIGPSHKYGRTVRCVRIRVRKAFQNMPKIPKSGKIALKRKLVILNTYNNLRKLGNSGVRIRNQVVIFRAVTKM